MAVKNIVKIMNFHALLRVNNARRRVEKSHLYEKELKKVIGSIINNRIFKQEHISLKLNEKARELNIYMGSDLGFCASFNSDVQRYLREDEDINDKIVIGKRISTKNYKNILLTMEKEQFKNRYDEIFEVVLEGILRREYSKINIIYVHYYNLQKQEIIKRTIFPFDYGDKLDDFNAKESHEDYVVEGDLSYIIWNLISIYVSTEIMIAEAWSWASENVERQKFTDESLNKIEEREEEQKKETLKAKHAEGFKTIVEMNNRKIRDRKEE